MKASVIRLFAGLLTCLAAAAVQADVVAVVSAKNPVTTLSRSQVSDIFLGKSGRYPNGIQAVPIDQVDGSPARTEFYATYTGKSPAQLKAHWSKVIFTGRGKPPASVANSIEVRKLIAADSRAISYIDRSAVDSSVRVLTEP